MQIEDLGEIYPPVWVKRTERTEPEDGAVYLIAVLVHNNTTGKYTWDIEKIHVTISEEGMYLAIGDEPYTDWEWDDVDYFIKVG